MNFAAIDWVIVIAYLAGSLFIRVMAKKFVGNLSDFLVAGRELGTHVGIATLAATVILPLRSKLGRKDPLSSKTQITVVVTLKGFGDVRRMLRGLMSHQSDDK